MNSRTPILIAATIVFVVTIGAVVAIVLAIEDGARATTMVGLVVAPLASLLGFLALFVKQEATSTTVAEIKEQTTELANGGGDAKFRAAVADVLRDELIDPAAAEQLEQDRKRRAAAAQASAAAVLERRAYPENDA